MSSSRSSGGVGQLVMEKKPRKTSKSAASKKRKADDDDIEDDASAASADVSHHSPKKSKSSAADTSSPKTKRGTSSVDTSHPLTTQQARHEEYMKCTAAELTRILGINQIAVPSKSKTKDRLAWQCVYGEALGAPVGHCPRCLHGKLKPKLKEEEWGMKVAKGTVKWVCPGFFDEETDAIKFCNKTYSTANGSEIATVPFKGVGSITPADIEELEQRKQLEREEREMIRQEKEEAGEQPPREHHHDPDDHRPEAVKHATIAPRLATQEEYPDFVSDPHSSASSAAPHAPHVKKGPPASPQAHAAEHEAAQHPLHSARDKDTKHDSHDSDEVKSRPSPPAAAALPLCEFDPNCYRKNPVHLAEFRHTNK